MLCVLSLKLRHMNSMASETAGNLTIHYTACVGQQLWEHQRSASRSLCEGNPPMIVLFPSQQNSDPESVAMSWPYLCTLSRSHGPIACLLRAFWKNFHDIMLTSANFISIHRSNSTTNALMYQNQSFVIFYQIVTKRCLIQMLLFWKQYFSDHFLGMPTNQNMIWSRLLRKQYQNNIKHEFTIFGTHYTTLT